MQDERTTEGMQLPLDQIICGDNCDELGKLPRECIDLVVTSPPYDDLRKYGGHSWDFYGVAWQLKRVLKPGGVIVWVVADATVDGSETGTSMRQVLHFMELGLRLHDTMAYKKPNPIPVASKHRYTQCFEFMWILSKGSPAKGVIIQTPTKTAGQTYRVRRNNGTSNDGGAISTKDKVYVTKDTRDADNIWEIGPDGPTEYFGHPAAFPLDLARDHIRSWSNEGDIVLDCFGGSGTTAKMARELGRHFIHIDVNESYCEIARKRLAQKLLFGVPQ